MAHSLSIRKVTKTFSPTNTQVNQSARLFTAHTGEIPIRAVARVLAVSNMGVPLVKLGDSGSTNRLLTAAQIDVANTGLKTGSGANDQAGRGHYTYTSNTQTHAGYTSNPGR